MQPDNPVPPVIRSPFRENIEVSLELVTSSAA